MSTDDQGPAGDRDGPEPRLAQWGSATHGGRVIQAGRNQYIFNTGNAVWLTAPVVVAVTLVFVLYFTIGRAPQAAGSLASGVRAHSSKRSPVVVTLAYDQHHVANGQGSCMTWIFGHPLSAIAAPSDNLIDETWAHRFGGVDTGVTNFKLAVQGVTKTAVQLLDFRVIDLKQGPAIHGTDIISSNGCGPAPEAGFGVALGEKPPVITPVSGLDNGTAKKIPFPFVVSSTDIQQFQVQARDRLIPGARPCGCEITWRLALDWSYEGKTGNTVIDDNGKPFQTFFPSFSTTAIPWFDASGVWKRM